MVHGQGLGDLEEPDQLEPVETLGAGLVPLDLWKPCVDGRVGGDEPVDVGEPEVAADGVHRGDDRGVHQPRLAEVADVELDMGSLDPDQRVQAVGLAPREPPRELEAVEVVGAPGVPGEVGDRRQLSGRHPRRLVGQQRGRGHEVTSRGDLRRAHATPAATAARAPGTPATLARHACIPTLRRRRKDAALSHQGQRSGEAEGVHVRSESPLGRSPAVA